MLLYSRAGVTAVDAAGRHYEPDSDGLFDVPDDLGARLRRVHRGGVPQWETPGERAARLDREQIDVLKADPAALEAAVARLAGT